jgi:hypothetical protein
LWWRKNMMGVYFSQWCDSFSLHGMCGVILVATRRTYEYISG